MSEKTSNNAQPEPVSASNQASGRPRPMPPAAERALAEAAERRRKLEQNDQTSNPSAKEIGGRKGPDPVRYGDWERGGLTSDF